MTIIPCKKYNDLTLVWCDKRKYLTQKRKFQRQQLKQTSQNQSVGVICICKIIIIYWSNYDLVYIIDKITISSCLDHMQERIKDLVYIIEGLPEGKGTNMDLNCKLCGWQHYYFMEGVHPELLASLINMNFVFHLEDQECVW